MIKKEMIKKRDDKKNKNVRWLDFGVWRRFGNSKKIKDNER